MGRKELKQTNIMVFNIVTRFHEVMIKLLDLEIRSDTIKNRFNVQGDIWHKTSFGDLLLTWKRGSDISGIRIRLCH